MDKTYNNNDELALLFKRIFATDDGKDLLSVLERRFERPSLVPAQAADGAGMTNLTYMRIGEQNVVKYIKTLIEREIKNDE